VWEDGRYVIYVHSGGRERESADLAKNLKSFLSARHPDLTVVSSDKRFLDLR
jgi:hypothetical protein